MKNIPDLLTWTFINDKENPSPSYFYEVRHFIFDLLGIQIDHRNEEEEHWFENKISNRKWFLLL